MNSVDIHFHLLPGVDDGPPDMCESVALARTAVADGTRIVVVTPHVRSDFVTEPLALRALVHELRCRLAAEGVPLELRTGGELGHDMVGRLDQAELEAIAQGPPDGLWLLVETPFEGFTADFHAATTELRGRGFGVVLAHPERGYAPQEGLRRELDTGSVAQVNALSLTGGHGPNAERTGRALVAEGLVSVVDSAAHGDTRPPALGLARAALLAHGADRQTAYELTLDAPRRLLARGMRRRSSLAA